MQCIATRIPLRQTNAFTQIVLDYTDRDEKLNKFYDHPFSVAGVQKAIGVRSQYPTDRSALITHLKTQYASIKMHEKVEKNINLLSGEGTFAVTTAHQPNVFTGPLYFIYKIVHVIKLAEHLNTALHDHSFVPVFYMGSEDADLDELGNFHFNGEKYSWNTTQGGAVGRMKIDKALLKLIDAIEGQLTVEKHGGDLLNIVRKYYKEGALIQDATFGLLNELFGKHGLIVLIADSVELKRHAIDLFKSDLLKQAPSMLVQETISALEQNGYKAQAQPRDVNLFYLVDGMRERIIVKGEQYVIGENAIKKFTRAELLTELEAHPERFSPNVILRAIYQEMILPNVVFVGGGGELAYWLQYRRLFESYRVPFPVLVLRNSYLVIEKKWKDKINKLGLSTDDIFRSSEQLINDYVLKESKNKIRLNGVYEETEKLYEQLKQQSIQIDSTLSKHIEALKTQSIYRLKELEKKMLRAEKRKFSDAARQVQAIKNQLFPNNGLQERTENFMSFYAKWGNGFLDCLLNEALAFEQEFVVLEVG